MSPSRRLSRYYVALRDFSQMKQFPPNAGVEKIIDQIWTFADGFFQPVQVKEELLDAAQEIGKLRPRNILELGTAGGGTLLLWSKLAHPEATIVTVDLPGGDFGNGTNRLRLPLLRKCGQPGQSVHLVRADSHSPATLNRVKELFGGQPVDFLFIDADHTDRGVRSDYEMYAPLVRPGGIIGFHDVAITNPEYGVRKLWTELQDNNRSRTILGSPTAFGIGLLYV